MGPAESHHEGLSERLREAAIEEELATGEPEETLAEARSHVLVRLGRMTAGFVLLVAGLAMLVLPGPGLLVIVAGLAVLARDVAWADRVLHRVRQRLPKMGKDKAD